MTTLTSMVASSTTLAPSFTPALQPPPGVESHPENPATLAHLADITIGICIPIVTIFFALRCYVRIFVKRTWIFEDHLVTIGWAGTIAYCGIMRATMSNHGGQHMWDITPDQAHQAAYWFNVCAIHYGVMIAVTKLAVLWLYRRVFSPAKWSWFDIAIVALVILIIGFYVSTTFVKIFECYPREKIWNKSLPGRCVQMRWILNVSGGFNTVTDYLIIMLPVHAVMKLKMDRMKRVMVIFAFTFGACAPIFATIGFVVRLGNSGNPDVSWKQPEILLWGAAELASGNLCVCFPELAVLFRRHIRSAPYPRRPTASQLASECKGQNGRHRISKNIGYPYLPKSLMTTTFTTDGDGPYVELQEHGNNIQVVAMGYPESDNPHNGVVMLKNEVRVERQQA
ncbi:putative integral membrane protein [Stachybotrys elegans]|uniref:Integral membrane protein n=1 Tax=Stachybotrys elegans TaxID=80388 RepID=A0A8K0T106_9HYPO|nr:putative integral membrane protein [Stachybotrys elegans]